MFKRIINVIKGFFGLGVSKLEKAAPEAVLENEKENLRKQIANYNKGLAAHAGLCERLMSQVKKLEKEEAEVRAKTTANLRAGNRELAGQHALRLQSITEQLTENRVQLEEAEKTYRELVRARDVSVEAAKKKIEEVKQGITEMKIKQATAELTEMATGMIDEIGGSGDTLNRLHEMVEEERQKAAGKARVAQGGLDTTDFAAQEAEQGALADQALADFAAAEGIAIESDKSTVRSTEKEPSKESSPTKQMGPDAQTQ
ncbi:MAG: PspA/IM30 family protein [Verrucomicrobiia bacterium]|jgi:phage shock protein A